MKLSLIIVLVSIAAATAAPTSSESDENTKVIVTASMFKDKFLVYTSQHDIVSLVNPAATISFKDDNKSSEEDEENDHIPVFFVEADINNGIKEYKGLYSLDKKQKNTVKLVLANGRDTAFTVKNKKKYVYFAADDGVYIYDDKTKSAKKYGTFDKSIIAIAKARNSDTIYVLTDDKDLYKITNDGKNAEKIDAIKKPEAIALDFADNLYFYTAGKTPQVFDGEKIKSYDELPSNSTVVSLIRPPIIVDDNYVIAIINDQTYALYENQDIDNLTFELQVYPTAYGLDAGFIQYYAYNKKIYEYNFLAMILEKALIAGLESYLQSNEEKLQRFASNNKV